jgi:hypothetical protein
MVPSSRCWSWCDVAIVPCYKGAAELLIVKSSDLHTDVCAPNDSSSSPMTQMCRIPKNNSRMHETSQ